MFRFAFLFSEAVRRINKIRTNAMQPKLPTDPLKGRQTFPGIARPNDSALEPLESEDKELRDDAGKQAREDAKTANLSPAETEEAVREAKRAVMANEERLGCGDYHKYPYGEFSPWRPCPTECVQKSF